MGDVLGSKVVEVVLDYCRNRRGWEKDRRNYSANRFSCEEWRRESSAQRTADSSCWDREWNRIAEWRDRLVEERREMLKEFKQNFQALSLEDASPLGIVWAQLADEFDKETTIDCQRASVGRKEDFEACQAEDEKHREEEAKRKKKDPGWEKRKFIRDFRTDLNAEPIPGFTAQKMNKYDRRIDKSDLDRFEKEKLHRATFNKYLRNLAHAEAARKQSYARFLKKCDEGYYPNADEWLKRRK